MLVLCSNSRRSMATRDRDRSGTSSSMDEDARSLAATGATCDDAAAGRAEHGADEKAAAVGCERRASPCALTIALGRATLLIKWKEGAPDESNGGDRRPSARCGAFRFCVPVLERSFGSDFQHPHRTLYRSNDVVSDRRNCPRSGRRPPDHFWEAELVDDDSA